MKTEYRNSDYFNETDVFLFYLPQHKHFFYSKCEFSNGYWWTVESLKYKCTSVQALNLNETDLKCIHLDYKGEGKITNYQASCKEFRTQLGIFWDSKKTNHSNFANHYFWTDANKIMLLDVTL